ncbi:hypothetical protein B0H34DRAFT_200483 [Crassisporium funariophilum]|nr:hypothetical protein B0H34DRAFT_200483 [Crassisporium funariophilum]
MVSTVQVASFHLESIPNLGALEIASFFSVLLFGVLLSQGYTYFRRSRNDRIGLKLLVVIVLSLETFHSVTAAHNIFYVTITKYKTAEANSYPLSANVAVETLITLVVQCFYSMRIRRLSGKLPISVLCFTLAMLRFIGGVAVSVESFLDVPREPNGLDFTVNFSWLITSTLAVGVTTDIVIAFSMCYYLRKLSSPSNMRSTTEVINRLIRWSLQTGLITSMTSVTVIICFQAMSNMVWLSLYLILAKLYSNSLLVSLNARPPSSQVGLPINVTTGLQFTNAHPPIEVTFQISQPSDAEAGWCPPISPKVGMIAYPSRATSYLGHA